MTPRRAFLARMLLALTACCAAYTTLARAGLPDLALFNAGVATLVSCNLIASNILQKGHGVDGRGHILSMPRGTFGTYFVCLALLVALAVSGEHIQAPVTDLEIRAFALSCFFGWMSGLADWYMLSFATAYYASENFQRMQLESQGLSTGEIDELVEISRLRGFFGPRQGTK